MTEHETAGEFSHRPPERDPREPIEAGDPESAAHEFRARAEAIGLDPEEIDAELERARATAAESGADLSETLAEGYRELVLRLGHEG